MHWILFQILAQELGPATNLSTMVKVITYINDLNDNPPVFDREMYIAEIPENITAGRRVTEVSKITTRKHTKNRLKNAQFVPFFMQRNGFFFGYFRCMQLILTPELAVEYDTRKF